MSSVISCLQVRSQLAEQLLEYLEKVQEDADKRLMPGRGEDMPPYFAGSDVRTPRGVYVWPHVIKKIRKVKPLAREGEQEKPEPDQDHKPQDEKPARLGVMNQDKESGAPDRYREDTVDKVLPWLTEMKQSGRRAGFRALVHGAPGQGKSWLTLQTSARQAQEAQAALESRTALPDDLVIPVTLRLAALVERCDSLTGDQEQRGAQVREEIHTLLLEEGCRPHAARFLADRVGTPKTWLYLDALDETPKGAALDSLLAAIDSWPGPIVVTTRRYARDRVAGHNSWKHHPAYQLAPLNLKQAQALIGNWFAEMPSRVEVRDRLLGRIRRGDYRVVSENPLMLTLLCAAAENNPLPDEKHVTRGELYKIILGDIFDQLPEPRPDEKHVTVDFDTVAPLAEKSAWRMADHTPDDPWLERDDLLDLIDDWVEEKKLDYPRGVLLATFEKARLLIPQTVDSHRGLVFAHRELGTFLAGTHLARIVKRKGWDIKPTVQTNDPDIKYRIHDWLCAAVWDPATEPIVGFAIGAMANPLPILEALEPVSVASPDGQNLGEDALSYRLGALTRCLAHVTLAKQSTIAHQLFDDFLDRVASRVIVEITDDRKFLFYEEAERCIAPLMECSARHDNTSALDQFTFFLNGGNSPVCWAVSKALVSDAGGEAETGMLKLLNVIEELLKNGALSERWAAMELLVLFAKVGSGVSKISNDVKIMWEEGGTTVRLDSEYAFDSAVGVQVDLSKTLSVLTELLQDADESVRCTATQALYSLSRAGVDVSQVLTILVAWLEDSDGSVRRTAAKALGDCLDCGWYVFKSSVGYVSFQASCLNEILLPPV